MYVDIVWGQEHLGLDIPTDHLVSVRREAGRPPLADPGEAVREALEKPHGFPPLRRALTPDDHIAVFVDERIAELPRLLPPVLEHLQAAHIAPAAITLVCASPSTGQAWLDELPEAFEEINIEVHDPAERKKLAYLATTKQGRRIYLNRTVVDADQTVLLTRRGYDGVLGYSGGEGALFPGLADEATQRELQSRITLSAPGGEPWKHKREAAEVAWLLGVPFLVQVIEGRGGTVQHVLGGPVESSGEGERLLDAQWRIEADEPADVVLATVEGDAARQSFDDLARAFVSASRVVKPGGKIVLLAEAAPELGASAALLRQTEEPARALKQLLHDKPADLEAGFNWASAAEKASLYLMSGLGAEVTEELFATPLEHPGQVQKLLQKRCLFLPDAHRTMAVLKR